MSSASPGLSDKRRRMLELLLGTNGAGLKQTARLRRVSRSPDHPPLSFAQQRLWFLDQLVPNSPFYNVPAAIRISAPLRPELLQSTLNEIIKRHEVLRTSFQERGGKPFQVIAPVLEIPFELRDLRSLNPAMREQVCLKLVSENATKPFDLSRGPLIRALLLQLDDADYVFLINLHHIIADGWSMGVMVEEFRQIYSAFAQGLASPLPELPVQYADFAVWQQNRLEAGELQQQLNYWTNKLQDLPLLALPTDFPHRDIQGFEGETIYYNLSAQLSDDIHSFSQKNGVTVYVTLLAAFNSLLYRYTGQAEIVIGEPVANRNYLELEPLIGFFVNSLVLRTDVSGDPTFRELLRRSRKEVLEVDANQDIPFEVLVDRLKPERTMGRNPLFQLSLQYFSGATTSPADASLPAESLRIEKGTASLDLAFDLAESPTGIVARIEYSTELFRRDTVERMAAHYENLLAAFIANPELRISQPQMVSAAEREQLLVAGNSRPASSSHFVRVHELFEAQVSRTPDLIAVSSGSRKLTYHELNERSNRLARTLKAEGIGPEKLVAIYLNRSIDAVVAVLAVWKAGGAYVPLDPSLPEERVRFVLDDAKPDLLLTASELDARLATVSTGDLDIACGPENLAYIIYTSGSSGVPKGVMVEHGAISRHLQWMQSEFPLTTSDRTLFKYSFSFDVSIVEMLQPLLAGAAMEVVESNGPLDVAKVAKVISDLSITTIDVVPSMLSALLDNPLFVANKSLRRVICGGEIMPPDLLKRLRDRLEVDFVNMYGPTEATITATYWRADDVPDNRIPIGRPAAPYSAYVLDRDGNLTPHGVPGELYLGGECLARGYVGRGDLTNQSFIRDPFSNDTAARLYRTGDRCRFSAGGNLEFLGRMDEQIKVRGYRIELGEIEAVLRANSTVRSCAVNVFSSGGHTQLAAYVVPNLGTAEFWPSIGEYFVYDGLMYAIMSSDRVRAEAYRAAIARAAPGKVVVDIGTGGDLALALMCLEAGARRVYSIEMLKSAYEQGLSLARRLNHGERLVLIHGESQKVNLPEKADVCVSELIGTIGSSEGVVEILNDARRFLRPGGEMIPQRCVTRIAAVSLPNDLLAQPRISGMARHYFETVFQSRGCRFDARVCVKNLDGSCIVSDDGIFEELVFDRQNEAEQSTEFELTINRSCRVDGFLLWVNLSPGPQELIDVLRSRCSWLPVFLPAFSPGMQLSAGDRIAAVASRLVEPGTFTPDYLIRGVIMRDGTRQTDFSYESRRNESDRRTSAFYNALHDSLENDRSALQVTEERNRVQQWRENYNELYAKDSFARDRDFDIVGWDSSFTGRPLSHPEMNEQVAATVQRIASLRGKRILEIGCGTGLLLLRLAGACERYAGTDISAPVLEQVRAAVAERQWSQVELWEREADNFEDIDAQTFDVVVLNSVVQYFPSLDYLVRVIRNACRILRPGGYIFLGDIRSLPLLRLLNTGIELERCGASASVAELHERVERRTREEPELVIDPVFFDVMQHQLEEITGASIQLKRGWETNELTCFRYDVCLQVNGVAESMEGADVFEWSTLSSVTALRDHLQQNAMPRLQVRGVPNARLQTRQQILKQLEQADPRATIKSLNLNSTSAGVEPEDFWALERDLDYEIQVHFAAPDNPASYHVLCTRREHGGTEPTVWRSAQAKAETKPWSAYANNMQHSLAERDHELMLRQSLGRKLPEYMIPATFVWMDTLPLTATGKVNRAALPEPDSSRLRLGEVYAPPETELQKQIATVWSEVLRLEKIGINSSFFNIGGHSLLAMQVISRLNDSLNLEIPLRLMFEVPTIRRFAEAVGELQAAAKEQSVPPIVPLRRRTASEEIDLERLSDEQVDALLSGLLTRDASASG